MKRFAKISIRIILILFVLANVLIASHAYRLTHYYDNDTNTSAQKPGIGQLLFGIISYKQKNNAPDTTVIVAHIRTSDNMQLESWIMNVPGAKGTVALFHGHGGNKSGVMTEAAAFRQMGYNTILTDFRAHGNSEGHTCTIGYNESKDVKAVYDYLQNTGEKNIVLWGISLGAAAISKAISDYHIAPKKIILEMPFGSLPQAVEGRLRMMHLPAEPLASMLTFWGGTENGFWAFNMRPSEYAKSIKCPVLLQWGANDPRVSKNETEIIFSHISSPKKLVIYGQSAHQSLCINEHEKWVREIAVFLQQP